MKARSTEGRNKPLFLHYLIREDLDKNQEIKQLIYVYRSRQYSNNNYGIFKFNKVL